MDPHTTVKPQPAAIKLTTDWLSPLPLYLYIHIYVYQRLHLCVRVCVHLTARFQTLTRTPFRNSVHGSFHPCSGDCGAWGLIGY